MFSSAMSNLLISLFKDFFISHIVVFVFIILSLL